MRRGEKHCASPEFFSSCLRADWGQFPTINQAQAGEGQSSQSTPLLLHGSLIIRLGASEECSAAEMLS